MKWGHKKGLPHSVLFTEKHGERYFSSKSVFLVAAVEFILTGMLWKIQMLMVRIFYLVYVLLHFTFLIVNKKPFPVNKYFYLEDVSYVISKHSCCS